MPTIHIKIKFFTKIDPAKQIPNAIIVTSGLLIKINNNVEHFGLSNHYASGPAALPNFAKEERNVILRYARNLSDDIEKKYYGTTYREIIRERAHARRGKIYDKQEIEKDRYVLSIRTNNPLISKEMFQHIENIEISD